MWLNVCKKVYTKNAKIINFIFTFYDLGFEFDILRLNFYTTVIQTFRKDNKHKICEEAPGRSQNSFWWLKQLPVKLRLWTFFEKNLYFFLILFLFFLLIKCMLCFNTVKQNSCACSLLFQIKICFVLTCITRAHITL